MAGRLLLIALAVLCATVGVVSHRNDDRCDATAADARKLTRSSPRSEAEQVTRDALDRCASTQKALAVAALVAARHRDVAVAFARSLAHREPRDYVGWLALSALESDPAKARDARRRALALNRFGVPPS